jgi:YidC/Oxa1 family membrane protein insertase
MKRNWGIIAAIIVLIIAYEMMILSPYQKKQREFLEIQRAQQQSLQPSATTSAIPTTNTPTPVAPKEALKADQPLRVSEEAKKQAVRIEIDNTRNFTLYSDASLGDVVFTQYFEREEEKAGTPIRIIENAFHWSSTDLRVNSCLRYIQQKSAMTFEGSFEDIKCSIEYEKSNLVFNAKAVISSSSPISGDLIFQTEDGLGDGPQFDHRYLTLKKKDEKTSLIRDKDLWQNNVRSSGPFDWISWGDKYFSATIVPGGRYNPDVFYRSGVADLRVNWGVAYPLRWSPENKSLDYDLGIYFAIKDIHELASVSEGLTESIDFGFFGGIAKFMLWCLESLNNLFGNFGIAIVILSLIIRLLLWPVNKKMFESGQKMKDLQPQMEAIKKKYEGKTDQMMAMNQEIRTLYQKSGVNPLGSCLPVLLQIPIFFGLNTALSNSVSLYQAPFFGWITDLSYKDPLYILPVLWTVSLLISVELTPQPQSTQPGMPNMKWISRIMFVVFGFISKDFPSGLNIYFLVSNLAGMFQQWLFKKKNTPAGQNILIGKER